MTDLFSQPQLHRHFSGSDYVPKHDQERLTKQIPRVYEVMRDGKYRTIKEICAEIFFRFGENYPETSVSANTRNLRKVPFGSHNVVKRHRGERKNGCWEYAIVDKII